MAVVGSGFGGLGTAVNLKRAGIDDFVILERAGDLGGTWRDNTYPGCQCDVPSTLYSFSFAPHPDWTRTFPLQSEIWDYLRQVVDRFALSSHIRYRHEVTAATWDEPEGLWRVETTGGPFTAQVLVLAPGALSEAAIAPLPGLERFEGEVFHSAASNSCRGSSPKWQRFSSTSGRPRGSCPTLTAQSAAGKPLSGEPSRGPNTCGARACGAHARRSFSVCRCSLA